MKTRKLSLGLVTACALALSACSSSVPAADKTPDAMEKETQKAPQTVKVVTNGSFSLPDDVLAAFTKESGFTVELVNGEESGTLDSKLILTKNNPVGDAVIGLTANNIIDVANAGVLDDSVKLDGPKGADKYKIAQASGAMPLDRSDACFNYDIAYFEDKGLTPPAGLEDLVKPEYQNLTVIEDPSKSDTGFALLAATISHFGEDGYVDYWKQLLANGTKVDAGWKDAYQVDFTAGEGKGAYPIVMSYASSPFWTINEAGDASSTANVAGGCYPVVEYAGVLKGAKNVEGAQKFLQWLSTPKIQTVIAEENVTYPIDESAQLPKGMAEFAPRPDAVASLDPQKIVDSKEEWITAVTELF
ncbi:thiamine ABC transporter substrate-binding protein [Arcanobacterium pinnipediorum]|uniref:Thiamine ABC transporter substrate-binding protein n=1 Tax=Arcanobacterium pinnipediorum TaxID=1503041 RepID=A0ABY5AI57_9ACTO|nr:thiamine ABC transporter substrate-binding protein [Arcanobacterium pinnipediorum]USR79542.1 thiamine ABC transporter substrate-binding protein [Arcanobacterium pinnipediorum]